MMTRRGFLGFGALVMVSSCETPSSSTSTTADRLPTSDGYVCAEEDNPALFGERDIAMGTPRVLLASALLTASGDQELTINAMAFGYTAVSWKFGEPSRAALSVFTDFRLSVDTVEYTGTLQIGTGQEVGRITGTISSFATSTGEKLIIPQNQTKRVDFLATVARWTDISLAGIYSNEWRIRAEAEILSFTYRRPNATTDHLLSGNFLHNTYALYRSTLHVADVKASDIPGRSQLTDLFKEYEVRIMAQTFTASPQGDVRVYGLLSEWQLENAEPILSFMPYRIYMLDPLSVSGVQLIGFGDADVVSAGTPGSFKNILNSAISLPGTPSTAGIKIPAGTNCTIITAFKVGVAFSRVTARSTLRTKLMGWMWSDGTRGAPTPVLSFPGPFDPILSYQTISQ